MHNPIAKLTDLGQSLWYDNIERRLINSGELNRMISSGEIRGLTSNPSIFQAAIANSNDYDSALQTMAWAGSSSVEIFEQLAVEDIQAAADMLKSVYDETQGGDGFVSLEVSPDLAYKTEATLKEARRLWKKVKRPNLMIKIPATKEGLPAIQAAVAEGINVNITLIFSLQRYREVIDAYLSGLEERVSNNQPIDKIASVASFFISRIDSKVDERLEEILREESAPAKIAQSLLGKIAIANAKMAYQEFGKAFSRTRFKKLAKKGARVQRPLWASTSTKNPAYPDTLYVDALIGENTVNTVPQQTLEAFLDHGNPTKSIDDNLGEAEQALESLEKVGISMEQVTQELEDEGVKAFADAYEALLATIEQRRMEAVNQLGQLAEPVAEKVAELKQSKTVGRMFKHDPTLWTDDPKGQEEIERRLGWLELPETSRALIPELQEFSEELQHTNFSHALLLGMGGSSLSPEVMSLMFGPVILRDGRKGLDLMVLDSTEPTQIVEAIRRSPIETTLFIVSSKSGTTAEVHAFMDYFWEKARALVRDRAGEHFVAVTDPGTPLEKLAQERGFRRVFNADPNVGGRYSALSAFGLVPAAIMGIDVSRLLDRAEQMAAQCQPQVPAECNPGLVLGAVMGAAVSHNRDKLTFVSDPTLAPMGSWLEQLIAESSGKEDKGIVPVDGEILESPRVYSQDRLFIYLRRSGMYDEAAERLRQNSFPILNINIPRDYDLGAEFYRWEFATAVACAILGVNAFDQPNVQDAKTRTKKKIALYKKHEAFEEGEPAWTYKGIRAYLSKAMGKDFLDDTSNLNAVMEKLVQQGQEGDYFAINAYLPRNPGMEILLSRLQAAIRAKTKLATTLGFGPRFLHSTGQLHKGGPNTGIFLQITAEPQDDLEIPEEEIPFSVMLYGQALGDFEALNARKRRAIHIHLPDHDTVHQLIEAVEQA